MPMRRNGVKTDLICSCMWVTAYEGRADIHAASVLLKSMPALKRISGGTRMRYEVLDNSARHSELELSTNGITLYYWFERPSWRIYTDNLLRLLALVAYLKGAYAISQESMHQYIVEALYMRGRDSLDTATTAEDMQLLVRRLSTISEMNARLSAENAAVSERSRVLIESNARLSGAITEMATAISERSAHDNSAKALGALGVRDETISFVLGHIGVENGRIKKPK